VHRPPRTESARQSGAAALLWLSAIALAFAALEISVAHGVELRPGHVADVPCAVLDAFSGRVQVLDAARTHLIDAVPAAGVPCGGWVSVETGWAELHHRDGFKMHLGAKSFAEFPESNPDGKHLGDHVVLYRGEVYGLAPGGSGELRMITANGRSRVTRGSVVLVFDVDEDETQLIALHGASTLENRFEWSRRIRVSAGEASALNFRLLRVVPTAPRALAAATLAPRLVGLHVEEKESDTAVVAAKERQERVLASELVDAGPDGVSDDAGPPTREHNGAKAPKGETGEMKQAEVVPTDRERGEVQPASGKNADAALDGEEGPGPYPAKDHSREAEAMAEPGAKPARAPASVHAASAKPREKGSYARHQYDAEDAQLRERWAKKMVAGEPVGERILFPDKFYGRPQQVRVQVSEPGSRSPASSARYLKGEESEKRRLIEELSQIREE
jgi:hypothetical protein